MKRLVYAFFRLFELRYSPRVAVLEVVLDLERLNHRLFEITESIKLPAVATQMRHETVPRTVETEIWGITDLVRSDSLAEAISELMKVTKVMSRSLVASSPRASTGSFRASASSSCRVRCIVQPPDSDNITAETALQAWSVSSDPSSRRVGSC